jgi:hypothetical protein
MFPENILTFHSSWENIELKIHLSDRNLGYMLPKGIRQTSIPNPKN